MKSESEIREKLEEAKKESSEAVKDSYNDKGLEAVNRGAIYGWAEALNWVLADSKKKDDE